MTATMADRVRAALAVARPGTVPARFEAAYQAGGTPTSTHLIAIAAAAGTTPIWLMTGWPAAQAIPDTERTSS
ncbi:hypothetical protein [Streptomyces sp. NPDC093269]|uniref:hypothetical protein n=1 Tax=Streptomyces sp. NPDC093269 TaxID=3366038 RepID=UPI0037FC781C